MSFFLGKKTKAAALTLATISMMGGGVAYGSNGNLNVSATVEDSVRFDQPSYTSNSPSIDFSTGEGDILEWTGNINVGCADCSNVIISATESLVSADLVTFRNDNTKYSGEFLALNGQNVWTRGRVTGGQPRSFTLGVLNYQVRIAAQDGKYIPAGTYSLTFSLTATPN